MFRKIVSNLSFSPALVGQLGFYAKRLRKEDTTRRLALIFVILALIIQSLAVLQPAVSANAASPNDMVNGGIGQSLDNFLSSYDSNTRNLKDAVNYIGITRDEIASAKYTPWLVGKKLSWGFVSHFSYSQGERQYNITNANDQQVATLYSRPLGLEYSSNAQVLGWVGNSKKIGWFAIMQASGDIVTDTSPILQATVCSNNATILASDSLCDSNIIKSKIATNISQGFVDATKITASSGDQISYTITVTNTGSTQSLTKLDDNISDVLDYSSIIDNGGGTLNTVTGILSWPDVTLKSNDMQTRTFVVRLFDSIPSTAQGASNLTSYDCVMTNTFGNSTNINVDCPSSKIIEKIATILPKTGAFINITFAFIILTIAVYFFARSRQLEKEIRIIRKNTNTGTI